MTTSAPTAKLGRVSLLAFLVFVIAYAGAAMPCWLNETSADADAANPEGPGRRDKLRLAGSLQWVQTVGARALPHTLIHTTG